MVWAGGWDVRRGIRYVLPERGAFQRAIVAAGGEGGVLELEIAARLQVVEDLLAHGAVVLEAGDDGAGVDVIEGLVECPVVFCIVDLKFTVGRIASAMLGGVLCCNRWMCGRGFYYSGWMGLKSVPITLQSRNWSAGWVSDYG